MKKFLLLGLLLSSFAFANNTLTQDVRKIEKDIVKTGLDVWVLVSDLGDIIFRSVPSGGALTVDGSVDAFLRQFKLLAAAIKRLEDKNMVNGAVVRDFSKTLTVLAKIHLELPVDLGGRPYDSADLYSQLVKLLSKCVGFSGLYVSGLIDSSIFPFLINNGGDVFSQAVLDAGKDWRKNQTLSFEEYLLKNYSLKNSLVSVPAKGLVAYGLGALIKNLNIADIAEISSLLLLNHIVVMRAKNSLDVSLAWSDELPFRTGFIVSFLQSVVKSLVLTTGCKATVDLVKPVTDEYIAPYVMEHPGEALVFAVTTGIASFYLSGFRTDNFDRWILGKSVLAAAMLSTLIWKPIVALASKFSYSSLETTGEL